MLDRRKYGYFSESNKEEEKLFRDYAKFHGITVSDLIRTAVIEKIENEIDIKDFDESTTLSAE